jgi:hypothetical protein
MITPQKEKKPMAQRYLAAATLLSIGLFAAEFAHGGPSNFQDKCKACRQSAELSVKQCRETPPTAKNRNDAASCNAKGTYLQKQCDENQCRKAAPAKGGDGQGAAPKPAPPKP